jgi:hypothetical protein
MVALESCVLLEIHPLTPMGRGVRELILVGFIFSVHLEISGREIIDRQLGQSPLPPGEGQGAFEAYRAIPCLRNLRYNVLRLTPNCCAVCVICQRVCSSALNNASRSASSSGCPDAPSTGNAAGRA